ncbi:hypothetical protein [Candidatus Poriferisodalis sp.]|uniref:hypothetical protein n=1 Tax=Candidatus Poriferisodalis sp. TaxID=3101277 RepID=UPI003B52ACA1
MSNFVEIPNIQARVQGSRDSLANAVNLAVDAVVNEERGRLQSILNAMLSASVVDYESAQNGLEEYRSAIASALWNHFPEDAVRSVFPEEDG